MGKSVYLIAAIITAMIFVAIFAYVKFDESAKVGELSNDIMALYEEQQSNKILQAYLNSADANSCIVFERQISRQLGRIYTLFSKLEQLKDTTFATSSESVKRQYLLASMSLWIDLKNAGKTCSFNIKPILYFFPDKADCIECDAMMGQLETLKSQCPEVRVFAFPAESKDFEFVSLLEQDYNVSSAPAMVIKNHVIYSLASTDSIKEWLDCNKTTN